ncbi:ABC transporter permease [Halobium salinum]|uniref:ABC transporter permease n=1 Tax=Halobium salinum TaxID=1364940 RepID=A0ABD5P732_9EURY|nr:ABC transporter permease [Halobium salinum]
MAPARRTRRVLRRVGFAVVAVYAVVTVTFALVAATANPNQGYLVFELHHRSKSSAEIAQAVDAWRAARNLDEPLLTRYVRWVVNVTTFDWGRSFESGAPVVAVLAAGLGRTLRYLVPGVVLSALAVPLGLSLVGRRRGLSDRVATVVTYVAFGVPGFFLTVLLALLLTGNAAYTFGPVRGAREAPEVSVLVPALVVTAGTAATVLRNARGSGVAYRPRQFVKQLRAKGASPARLTRHVFRNTVVPLFTLLSGELVPLLVLEVVVIEQVLTLPGFGTTLLAAISARDLPVVVGATMVVVFVGIGGNLVQDLLAVLVDPRSAD